MKVLTHVFFSMVACAAILSFAAAHGDDLNPPDLTPIVAPFGNVFWNRPNNPDNMVSGLDSSATFQTTYQVWDSDTIDQGQANTFGYGQGNYVGPFPNLAGFTLSIPNFDDTDTVKLLRLQVTATSLQSLSEIFSILVLDSTDPIIASPLNAPTPILLESGLFYSYQDWLIEPNPQDESITIESGSFFDISQVVIDTISFTPVAVPEPATMVILGSSIALGTFARRKRVRK